MRRHDTHFPNAPLCTPQVWVFVFGVTPSVPPKSSQSSTAGPQVDVHTFLPDTWLLWDGRSIRPWITRRKVHFAAAVTDNGRALTIIIAESKHSYELAYTLPEETRT
jgi:hypothetical protein